MLRRYCISVLALLVAGCAFSKLDEDLDRLDTETHLFSGVVNSELLELHATVIVSLADAAAEDIVSFRMLSGEGSYEIRQPRTPAWFFAFADLNKDLRFQAHEPYGWAAGGDIVEPGELFTGGIDIVIAQQDEPTYPVNLVDQPLEDHLNNYARAHIGSVSSLEDPLFSRQQGNKGLWEPYAFWEDGGTGLHFLQPFDPDRMPVLFIHGINGSPQDFVTMIERLDTSRYQAWFVSYPSGLRLSWLSRGVFQFMEALHRRHEFEKMHLVAHSGGGLVSRGALNLCAQNSACGYITSFTAISTPWGGVSSAESGVKWAPTVIPVWRDLTPDSEFVASLFDTPLPDGMPFNLLFSFRKDGFIATGSSDGVIQLSSQLRHAAQDQATTLRGYDEGHVSILRDEAVIENVYSLIEFAAR
jgi:pimeloyl-ACP methyl ester carboxylesterase